MLIYGSYVFMLFLFIVVSVMGMGDPNWEDKLVELRPPKLPSQSATMKSPNINHVSINNGNSRTINHLESITRSSSTVISENNIKIMTFNIRYANANDGMNAWEYRKAGLISYLNGQFDILLLQEVLTQQLQDLKKGLAPYYKFISQGRQPNGGGEACTILYDSRKFNLLFSDTFWLAESLTHIPQLGFDSNYFRICTYGVFYDLHAKRTIVVMNTHIDHQAQEAQLKGPQLLSQRAREIQLLLTSNEKLFVEGQDDDDDDEYENYFTPSHVHIADAIDESQYSSYSRQGWDTGDEFDEFNNLIDFGSISSNLIVDDDYSVYTNTRTQLEDISSNDSTDLSEEDEPQDEYAVSIEESIEDVPHEEREKQQEDKQGEEEEKKVEEEEEKEDEEEGHDYDYEDSTVLNNTDHIIPIILGGDFNVDQNSIHFQNLLAALPKEYQPTNVNAPLQSIEGESLGFFYNTFDLSPKDNIKNEYSSFNGFTYPPSTNKLHIDHLLVSANTADIFTVKSWRLGDGAMYKDSNGDMRYCSDHFPIQIEVGWV